VSEASRDSDQVTAPEGGANGAAGDPPAGAPNEVAALTAERDEIKDRMLRLAAEFENWKKRARKEQDDAAGRAREGVLKEMLEVIDNLERAVSAYGDGAGGGKPVDGPAILKGVGLVLRLFQGKLERFDVRAVPAKGEPFDPHVHEAISRVETADVPAGHVAAELQRGYRIGDRLLRPSMVTVAVAPSEAELEKIPGVEGETT
jgi:molecular chaperone GrpE